MAQFSVRDAEDAELPLVRQVLTAANEPARDALPPRAFEAYIAMVHDLEGRRPDSELIVAASEGDVVGTVTFYPDAGREGWGLPVGMAGLRAMAVAPVAQGSGVAGALVDECVRRATANGATAIGLHTARFLPWAVRFYERLGFVRDPEHDRPSAELLGLEGDELDTAALAYRLDLH